jgi:hypothetical protein
VIDDIKYKKDNFMTNNSFKMETLMLNSILKQLLPFKSTKNNYKIQSFTFFIPSPPPRNTGYREKQFDRIFYEFINKGFEIVSFKTQACSSTIQSGMWIICVVRALNEKANQLSLDDIYNDQMINRKNNKNEVEGLYYIDDLAQEE